MFILKKIFTSSATDHLGTFASALCVVHCLVTPLLLSSSVLFAHLLPPEAVTHRSLAVIITLLGATALLTGYRKHQRSSVPILMAGGLMLITLTACFGEALGSHTLEVLLTVCGSAFLMVAHRLNHTFCRNCRCSCAAEGPSTKDLQMKVRAQTTL